METDGRLHRPRTSAALRHVSDRIAKLPDVRDVKSLVHVTSFRWVPEDEWIEIRPLIEEIPADPAALAALRSAHRRRSPLPAHARLRGRPHRRAQRLVPQADRPRVHRRRSRRPDPAHPRRGDAGRPALPRGRAAPREIAGLPPDDARSRAADAARRRPGSPLVLTFCLGSWRGVVLPLGSVLIATLWTFGAIALLGRPLTILTVILAPNLISIGSVYGVHVITRYEEESPLRRRIRRPPRCAASSTSRRRC